MKGTNNIFNTDVVNLSKLDKYNFTIPTYQRPYVWGDEQLKKLLEDFYKTFDNNPESIYYISTFLTKEIDDTAELIDGQQRFTTLWLIAFTISKKCPQSEISKFLKKENKLRLGFEIRKEISDFLADLLNEDKIKKNIYDNNYIKKHPYIRNIAKALVFINGYLEQLEPKIIELFGNYIYNNVFLIKNTAPINTDLNKLFSTINSAGVQLEQTDIVKANLLNLIDNKVLYGKIWETCENMNNFFERNARASFSASNWGNIDLERCYDFNEDTFKYHTDKLDIDTKIEDFLIDNITINEIPQYTPPKKHHLNEDGRKSEEIYCRSIINFGQILIHTYRIHLKEEKLTDFKGTFHVNRLIEIFSELEKRNNQEEIKRFFKRLWKVRYLFDKYIIKWISNIDNKTETLELANFNKNEKSYYSRTIYAKSPSLMLQSVLYFTGDYLRQYWLSSYLDYLYYNHKNTIATAEEHLIYLEKIDNVFSLNKNMTDKELSWKMMHQTNGFDQNFDIKNYLSSSKGTSFKHYWFQKLEYVLWKNWSFEETLQYKNYRISSKNSVEHIYPQHPENKIENPVLEDNFLNSFGNLVLLSVSQNSEYSNKSVKVKKSMFQEKSDTYDTLKSFFIFKNEVWNDKAIDEHRKEMIEKIINHYNHEN